MHTPHQETPGCDPEFPVRPPGTRWLSRSLTALAASPPPLESGAHFDVVIVGSGYGGAMAAAELAGLARPDGKPLRVCVLERGKEYTPGMFPSSGHEMPAHVRVRNSMMGDTVGALDGLFDVRLGPDVCALVGNGLGGGSLINAGVMEIPEWTGLHRLPAALRGALTPAALQSVKRRLGAADADGNNTVYKHARKPEGTAKTALLRSLLPRPGESDETATYHPAAITVDVTGDSATTSRCTMCGDCMSGCNAGAKKSLDTSLLAEAHRRGAVIYTGASVLDLKRPADGTALLRDTPQQPPEATPRSQVWELCVVYTDEAMRRRNAPLRLRARHVILAAGTLGSPEILMRSQGPGLRFSHRLGQQFSCNGDNILAVHRTGADAHTVAAEHLPLNMRDIGPTIGGVIRMPATDTDPGFLIQEFAVPAALKRVFDEVITTSGMLYTLAQPDAGSHGGEGAAPDPLAVDPAVTKQALLLGLIGHDESAGTLTLAQEPRLGESHAVEGRIRIGWPAVKTSQLLDGAYARAEALILQRLPRATVLPNPIWRMLPAALDFLFTSVRGPLLTVHPLGGCPMGSCCGNGAVNEFGQVFNLDATRPRRKVPAGAAPDPLDDEFHAGLMVLDGSILPHSLGANPALTIASVAERAAKWLARREQWVDAGTPPADPGPRPQARPPHDVTPPAADPTGLRLTERLCGIVQVDTRDYMAEVTLQYAECDAALLTRSMARRLEVDPQGSMVRLYTLHDWEHFAIRFQQEDRRSAHAALQAPLSGALDFLHREASCSRWRTLRGFSAWLLNRGTRDSWPMVKDILLGALHLDFSPARMLWRRGGKLLNLASHAGEVRRFDYRLTLGTPVAGKDAHLAGFVCAGREITGFKRFTYSRHSNPWRQLTELTVTDFPCGSSARAPVLKLDARFVARQGIPLAQIVGQQNQVAALAELASVALYFMRLFVSVHLWSFRAPDTPPDRAPQLLPGKIDGLPGPVVTEIELDLPRRGIPVAVRLTRYTGRFVRNADDTRPPLVLVHGYSASGSTFTHDAIPEPMARWFWQQGRDVWVVDLRTSAGMPSATLPWNFEDAALADLPVAIAHVVRVSGRAQVDVLAHCIGAVMLSMALLTDPGNLAQLALIDDVAPGDEQQPQRYLAELRALPASIRRIVLCQKGPVLVYSDDNILRAYLMRMLRKAVLPDDYQFRTPSEPSMADQLMDRFLATLPYPEADIALENPLTPWRTTPWTGFRHRMDALYARDFSLKNMAPKTLEAIDSLFGPLNLDTVAQAIHFARFNSITNGAGRNCFVSISQMRSRWPKGGTLAVHGVDNGLADVQTVRELRRLMHQAHVPLRVHMVAGYGHQDCLVGINAARDVFASIEEFLA